MLIATKIYRKCRPGTLLSIVHIPPHLTSHQPYEGVILIIIPVIELTVEKLKVKTWGNRITCSVLLGFKAERQHLILDKRGVSLFHSLHVGGGQRGDGL